MKLSAFLIVAAGTLAANAAPTRIERNLIGNQLQVIGLASQNSAVNNGNTGETNSHTSGSGNSAQQVVTDAQSIDVIKDAKVLDNPLILVKKRNTIGNNVGALLIASQNQGANAGNDGSTSSHGSSNGNTLANNIADQSNVALVNTAKVAEDALVTAKREMA